MNPGLLQTSLQLPYRRESWFATGGLLSQLLPGKLERFAQPVDFPLVAESQRTVATGFRQLGRTVIPAGTHSPERIVALHEIDVAAGVDLLRNRVALRQLIVRGIDEVNAHAVLAFFVQPGESAYRLTYAARESVLDPTTLAVERRETAARRFTYVLGPGETRRTAAVRLAGLGQDRGNKKLVDVTAAFAVESLSKEFFDEYRRHYQAFCTHLLSTDAPKRIFGLKLAGLDDKSRDRALKPVRDFIKKLLGRLVFLCFLQKKGWLGCPATRKDWAGGDSDFLHHLFRRAPRPDRFHSDRLVPLFFDTLNNPKRKNHLFAATDSRVPYLNGGLFERDFARVAEIDFPAPLFAALLEFFGHYHFTIDENDPEDHEIGIDPEMLGHIFENLLEDNKDKGAYYTPKAVVHYMARQSLVHALAARFPGDAVAREEIAAFIRDKDPVDPRTHTWIARHATVLAGHLDDLRICDPAIGSGAFPIGVLNEIYWAKLALNPSLDRAEAKRSIIQRSIHGVDLDAGAVEIARLRFWLALVVEEAAPVPLPNLDYQIMQGNSLLESFEGEPLDDLAEPVRYGIRRLGSDQHEFDLGTAPTEIIEVATPPQQALADLRRAYFACHDPEDKSRLRAQIDDGVLRAIDARLERRRDELETSLIQEAAFTHGRKRTPAEEKQRGAMKAELAALVDKSGRLHTLLADPRAERPFFLWHLWFRHVLADPPEGRSGFDIVIANPPYIPMEGMSETDRETFQEAFSELTRKFDSAAVFVLHSLGLLNPDGCLTFISSVTWQTGENYSELRKTLFCKSGVERIINLPFDIFSEAYVDTCIFIILRKPTQSYRISILPKKAKVDDFSAVPFTQVPCELVVAPSFKVVLDPLATALFRRIAQRKDVVPLGTLTKSTQGLAGNRFKRVDKPALAPLMRFAEEATAARYKLSLNKLSVVDMSEHSSLVEFYVAQPKLLVRRIISRQDRIVVARYDGAMVFKKDVSPFVITDERIQPNYLFALLNSQLLSWLYIKTSSIATKDDFRQTTLAELRALPIPAPTPVYEATLTTLVDRVLVAKQANAGADTSALEAEIDRHVYALYGLTPAEIKLVEESAAPKATGMAPG